MVGSTLGCFQTDSIVDIHDPGSTPPLGTFRGHALIEEGTAFGDDRSYGLQHPTIAVVYQYLGPRSNIRTGTFGTVTEATPYDFEIGLREPPPKSLLEDDEVAVGQFWIFEDRNRNGKLDRSEHPEYRKRLSELDSLTRRYYELRTSLREVSLFDSAGVVTVETTLVAADGELLLRKGGVDTPVWPAFPGLWSAPIDPMHTRIRVLTSRNPWEKFFERRKRWNSVFYPPLPNPDVSLQCVARYRRRLFPVPGKEEEFARRTLAAGLVSEELYAKGERYQSEAFLQGWLDYPYNGIHEEGEDWAAGRSREHFLFYFPTWKSIDVMRKASEISSFRIAGMDRFAPGYNLLRCDDQYRCERTDPDEKIRIYLGKNELYFNPPSVLRAFDLPTETEAADTPVAEGDPAGRYEFQPGADFFIERDGDDVWIDAGPFGASLIRPASATEWYGPGFPFKLQFQFDSLGRAAKFLLDWEGARYAATRIPDGDADRTSPALRALRERMRRPVPDTSAARWNGMRLFNGDDTLTFATDGEGDLTVHSSWLPQQRLVLLEDGAFGSVASDLRIRESRRNGFLEPEWTWFLSGNEIPLFALSPSGPQETDSTRFDPDRLLFEETGTERESFRDYRGLGRFSCSEDSLFLVDGDGGFFRSVPDDSLDRVALEPGSAWEFELGKDGETADGWEFSFCSSASKASPATTLRAWFRTGEGEWEAATPPLRVAPDKSKRFRVRWTPPAETRGPLRLRMETAASRAGGQFLALDRIGAFGP